jgi:hypothetical protein
MPNYDYHCAECQEVTVENFSYDERPQFVKCDHCDSNEAEYRIASPMVMERGLPDGLRAKKDDWKKLREASKLNVEMARTPVGKRAEMRKEMDKLGVKLTKEK